MFPGNTIFAGIFDFSQMTFTEFDEFSTKKVRNQKDSIRLPSVWHVSPKTT